MRTQIPMMKIYHCQVKQSTPQWKTFWCVIQGWWNIWGGTKKCDRLYERDCRSEYQILVVEKRPYMGTQIPMMKIYHCQVKQSTPQWKIFWRVIQGWWNIRRGWEMRSPLWRGLSIREYEMLVEYSERGLKNAITFMNGIVDPNIKYWWLKEDLIWAHRFPWWKYIIVKSSSQPPNAKFSGA
jgi:hypothetical protein